jgi:hypothetical protein
MLNSITIADGLPDAKGKCEAQRNTVAQRSPKLPELELRKQANDESPQ